ncbi:MAG: DUF2142 domain-containing protein [Armatimonadetes bacterium]|nr:DUF2142 domain-containing protein [Armatimonadota bacterium]
MANSGKRLGWFIAGLAALHFVLALGFASVTPYRAAGVLRFQGGQQVPDVGAPDERQHANYIQHLLDGKGLPTLVAGDFENYESHQPPLYYLTAAGWAKALGVSDVSDRSAGLRLRSLNALIGAAGVVGVFFLAWWGRRNLGIAFGAAGFAALLPSNLGLSGSASNDPLLIALCTWTLALCVLCIRDGWSLKRAIGIGLLAGLAVLSKTSAVALLPILALVWWLSAKAGKGPNWKCVAAVSLPLLVLVTPLFLRNQSLYGDPLALSAFTKAFPNSPSPQRDAPVTLAPLFDQVEPAWAPGWLKYWSGFNEIGLGVGWWTLRGFFGAFGYMDIFMHGRIYGALGLLLLLVFVASWLPDRSEEATAAKSARLLGQLFAVLIVLFFLRFNTQYFQAQARYLLPALGPISLAVSIGVVRLAKAKAEVGAWIIGALLLAIDIGLLTWLPGEFAKRVTP